MAKTDEQVYEEARAIVTEIEAKNPGSVELQLLALEDALDEVAQLSLFLQKYRSGILWVAAEAGYSQTELAEILAYSNARISQLKSPSDYTERIAVLSEKKAKRQEMREAISK